MRRSIAMVHEQGGLAIVAHPLPPYPMCASERTLRRLMDEPDQIFHPDALEALNPTTARMPWSRRAAGLAEELGIAAVAGSDAHRADNVGSAVTIVRGEAAEDLRVAIAARDIAEGRGLPLEVIVGEEISTRSGHLVGLWMRRRVRPWHSMRRSIAMVHEQGGLAIVAHPLPPYPMCASERTLRRLMDEPDSIFHPDALEALNPTTARMPWSRKAAGLAEELGIASVAGSDAHRADKVGTAVTIITGEQASDLRAALAARDTAWDGRAYGWTEQLRMFGQQQRKNAVAVRDELRGSVRRDGTGRDLGYPGGRRRPVRFDRVAAGLADPEGEA
jgi:predicted metal-dependent phosphoesterase TrpH